MTATYFVSTSGSDGSGDGSEGNPFASLGPVKSALENDSAPEGSTVYFRAGTYSEPSAFSVWNVDGTDSQPITFEAYQGESVTLDYSALSGSTRSWNLDDVNNWIIKGLEFRDGPWYGLFVGNLCSNVQVLNCEFHHFGNSGIYFYSSGANNLVRNCSSHHNADSTGGNADGLGAAGGIEGGITVEHCQFYQNSDDGCDFWGANGLTVRHCMAYRNGYDNAGTPAGDGNGFKLGGKSNSGGHLYHNNVSFDNRNRGMDHNDSPVPSKLYNNTCFGNGGPNYRFSMDVAHELRNNISYKGSEDIASGVDDRKNSWNLGISDPKFKSLDRTSPDFVRLSADSPCIDSGIDVGLSYSGSQPDLGAYEYKNPTTITTTTTSTPTTSTPTTTTSTPTTSTPTTTDTPTTTTDTPTTTTTTDTPTTTTDTPTTTTTDTPTSTTTTPTTTTTDTPTSTTTTPTGGTGSGAAGVGGRREVYDLLEVDSQLILTAPNGTRYSLRVDDEGNLTTDGPL